MRDRVYRENNPCIVVAYPQNKHESTTATCSKITIYYKWKENNVDTLCNVTMSSLIILITYMYINDQEVDLWAYNKPIHYQIEFIMLVMTYRATYGRKLGSWFHTPITLCIVFLGGIVATLSQAILRSLKRPP